MADDLKAKTTLLMLEVTSHCNMHCTFCPSDDLVWRKGHVSDEQAIQLIRAAHELAPGIPIMFNVLGEPFLNKKLFDYIALCEECGVNVALITNITLLTEERLKKLYQFKNVHMNMSLHTPTDKAFAERGYKKISSFREYMEMVCNAVEAKFRYRSKAGLEIYLASELTENLMQNDNGSRLWTMFDDPEEYQAGWKLVAERFTELSARIERDYPEEFAQAMTRIMVFPAQRRQIREVAAPFPSNAAFRALLSAYDASTKKFSLEQNEEFYGQRERMVREEVPLNLRRETFYRLTLLSPTFVPKTLYGSADERRLGLAVTSLRLTGRPFENISKEGSAQTPVLSSSPGSISPAYTFPILT